MTPHDFCCWLKGYLHASIIAEVDTLAILRKLDTVDLSAPIFVIPSNPDDSSPPPSSPPMFSPRDPDGWETPWYWDSTTYSWQKLPPVVAQYYRDQFRPTH